MNARSLNIDKIKAEKRITQLRVYANNLSKSEDFSDGLASSMIYAGLAENVANKLFDFVEVKINRLCWEKRNDLYIDLTRMEDKSRPTNLEYVLQRLERYVFPYSDTIIPLLYKVKKDRNDLFHKLVSDKSPRKPFDTLIRNLQKDVERLIEIYLDSVDTLLTIKPLQKK